MIPLAIIGIGGYGAVHVSAAQRLEQLGVARLVAAADVRLDAQAKAVEALQARGTACYADYRILLERHPEVRLVTLPLPIHLHAPLAVECLGRGLHVLMEKPPAGCTADVHRMRDAARAADRLCGVSFQYSTSRLTRRIVEVIAGGKLGRITEVSALCLAQRMDGYYARAPWAGKIRLGEHIVRDGSLNNPFAHIAQLLLTFGGAADGRVARPADVSAALYAGHAIESEDTCAVQARLDSGVRLRFYASLCSREAWTQQIRVVGTAGRAEWCNQPSDSGVIRYADGTVETLPPLIGGDEGAGSAEAVFHNFVDVLEGRAARLVSALDDTLGFAELVEGAFDAGPVRHLANTPHSVRAPDPKSGDTCTYLQGIETCARQAFESGCSFVELGAPWAV